MIDQHVLPVVPGVSWIGILDPDLVTFDVVMETKYGTTYNSYFIDAEKKAVIDTCKETFWPVYEAKLRAICDPAEIEYIIVNHTEPDHSGSVKFLLEIAPKAVVVGTGNAIRYLKDLIGHDFAHIAVKEGHTLDLGNKTLQFINAPNLHWPDTMYTWLVEDRLLFTCDSFGCHYSHPGVFDDKVDYFDDAFKYYYDVILRPYSKFMLKAIHKIRPLDIAMICPGHGPVLRSYWKKYLDLTEEFALDALKYPDKKKREKVQTVPAMVGPETPEMVLRPKSAAILGGKAFTERVALAIKTIITRMGSRKMSPLMKFSVICW